MAPKVVLRIEPYDPDARDADGDGIIQEGTAWERPAGTRLITNLGEEIQRGLTASARPQIRVVDSRGVEVQYRPTYDVPSLQTPQRSVAKPGSKLRSLADMGIPTVGQILSSRSKPATPSSPASAPKQNPSIIPEDVVRDFTHFLDLKPRNQRFHKYANRDVAFRKADRKAQELAFTGGTHYLLETDEQFVILSQADFRSLNGYYGEDRVRRLAHITEYGKPVVAPPADLDEVRANLKGPDYLDGEIDTPKYLDGVIDVHYKNGSLADLEDGVFAAVVFDEGITDDFGTPLQNLDGFDLSFEDIMMGTHPMDEGDTFENRRFKFEVIKDTLNGEGYGGIWTVFRATDKETGEVWYIKSSTYGANDGMLENVGMRAGALLDLAAKPDEKHIRTGSSIIVTKEGRREVRWTAMRNVGDWDNPEGPKLDWVTADDAGGIDPTKVHMGDLGQILVMDFVMGNTDRHSLNFMVATDADGRQRLALIDNGLLSGGRIYEIWNDWGETLDPQYFIDFADEDAAVTLEEWASGKMADHNGMGARLISSQTVLETFPRLTGSDIDSDEFENGVKQTIRRLKANIDSLTNPEYFEKRGIPLTASEKAHLDAVKTIALARIRMLQSNPYALSEYIVARNQSPMPKRVI